MSDEPGLTLGRLVAAERNAATALARVKELEAVNSKLEVRLSKLEARVQQDAITISALNARTVALIGTGATAGG